MPAHHHPLAVPLLLTPRVIDVLAFLGVLVFVGVLMFLVDRTGQLSARLAFAGAAGLVAGGVTVWRRLRRPELRCWRSGQAIYRGRRVTVVSAWGVGGQPPPAIEPPTRGAGNNGPVSTARASSFLNTAGTIDG